MKAEKRGGRAENSKMLTVASAICGMDMACPESMLGFVISTGMPPPMLDDLEEVIREAKRGMGEGK
jgi:hypothetical protein